MVTGLKGRLGRLGGPTTVRLGLIRGSAGWLGQLTPSSSISSFLFLFHLVDSPVPRWQIPSPSDRVAPCVSDSRIRCGCAHIRCGLCACVRVCVVEHVYECAAREVFSEMPQRTWCTSRTRRRGMSVVTSSVAAVRARARRRRQCSLGSSRSGCNGDKK